MLADSNYIFKQLLLVQMERKQAQCSSIPIDRYPLITTRAKRVAKQNYVMLL